tara:strand:+ start:692 stop:1012 length:321 start_codon:yes stop_codon:yes gene_type:complete
MDEGELREKLEKLQRYEAKEREIERWKPYEEMEAHLSHMYSCKTTLENAAWLQDEANDISSQFDLGLMTWGSACMQEALAELEAQIEEKEKESEVLYTQLVTEEEE